MSEQTTPVIDTPVAYQAEAIPEYALRDYTRLASGAELTAARDQLLASDRLSQQLAAETELLGIEPFDDPDHFVAAHNQFIDDAQAELTEVLPTLKAHIVSATASYLAKGDEAAAARIRETLIHRLAATERVIVVDTLLHPDTSSEFVGATRQPVITTSELVRYKNKGDDRAIKDVVLAHEIIHGMLTAGVQKMWLTDTLRVRNGLSTLHVEDPMDQEKSNAKAHGAWISEAVIESIRQKIMKTTEVRYEPGVMVLRMLDELQPGLEDRSLNAALAPEGPGPVFGEVESLLGPTAIENIEVMLGEVDTPDKFQQFKAQVIGMLPKDLQASGRAILERKQDEVFADRADYHAGTL